MEALLSKGYSVTGDIPPVVRPGILFETGKLGMKMHREEATIL
jgi:hypothetical protein